MVNKRSLLPTQLNDGNLKDKTYYPADFSSLVTLSLSLFLTMRAMTAMAARMREYQYLVTKLVRVMMLFSEKSSSRKVKRGPRGST